MVSINLIRRVCRIAGDIKDIKNEFARKLGVTVVVVPCWWDNKLASLLETIKFLRPDVDVTIPNCSTSCDTIPSTEHDNTPSNILTTSTIDDPISLNPHQWFFVSNVIPDVGEVMLATFLSSSTLYNPLFTDSSYWWIGEKYDGIHCVWHPLRQMMFTRRGQALHLPGFTASLCQINSFLEGELLLTICTRNGRGMFYESQRIRVNSSLSDLPYTRMVVFDEPSIPAQNLPFELRYKKIHASVAYDHQFIMISFRLKCFSEALLRVTLKIIIEGGGEGVMMRMPKSLYENGRATSLIKFKVAQGDSEALVVNVDSNKLTLQLPSGQTFDVEQHFKVNSLPNNGDVVTFEYDNFLRREVPVNPKIVRIREDISWEDVLYDYENAQDNSATEEKKNFFSYPPKYWTREGGKNLRIFLEDFVRKQNLDPLLPETWYTIPANTFAESKANRAVFQEGSFVSTLAKTFPELDFDVCKFVNPPKGRYLDVSNRKAFFDELAKRKGFDPLISANWYSLSPLALFEKMEDYLFITRYYQGNYIAALEHIYPDIGLEAQKFPGQPRWFMDSIHFKKRFFAEFAKLKGFDPLVPDNWYSVTYASIKAQKYSGMVLRDYQQSIQRALLDVFPNIGLRLDKFHVLPRGYWARPKNRKQFFDQFAKDNGFDPLIAKNWHKQSANKFLAVKNAHSVLHHYKGSYQRALLKVYPNIGLKFDHDTIGQWKNIHSLRNFFDKFARERGFDPLIPKNWYTVSRNSVLQQKPGEAILQKFNGFKNTLLFVYPHIGLEISKFESKRHYAKTSNRKAFFDKYAQEQGFDPLIATNWYSDEQTFKEYPGSRVLLGFYGGSLRQAVDHLYSPVQN